ncbi:hypothetical protein GLOIN_2v1791665 [Rhizophagus irregularis DAOM 181602=DAOM 197198]|uniref:SWIM-type domain-containing protein n=2 Tax=Rhizophagus irregularis TaxID=588596 RepID=A0A015J869_RHIIW|nr:hypothetical protein GLOIN_2v1791665 [Rhizophagus irregularis DAOM 181602=DAOM 197198]EXX63055.1 hypothetical protein RirG_155950 [Rhizophagus irregularis DAOM 197198w]POG57281.1 hypothetical protein GLOIN_2v1791665 [Rhizophagus irregularis DAOM 181602=DAOM 197198]GBC20020.2 hypothetical protein GLOIN_2v1791665 [Rhizophagus irregularis DAOM 181602=DAOM 197198]GET58101.1 hypothetical protein GLOIN_2v1791665 [Rhizophagus irregularis DAOM 181602=DAOM 197198]|eukprot:XP_025164422.1 hypothetical protein GLOIN_2v1791665 [Rhizophagus irregularis DAOM 181602=DAOM 197198]
MGQSVESVTYDLFWRYPGSYYTANLVEDIRIDQIDELAEISELTDKNSNKISEIDLLQATLKQIIQFVGSHNVKEIWAINVGNSLKIKHYVLLLQNGNYICSCLSIIQTGIICRHYFQVMLNTKNAVFHIQFIPSRWYNIGKNGLQEPFLIADKFMQEDQYITYDSKANLCLFNQYNNEFYEERLTVLDQQIIYGKLHGMYKKALNKALKNSSKSEELINLLQEFAEDEDDSQMDQIFEEDISDKKNEENVESSVPILQNPRKKCGKGRPVGTKRFKSSCEVSRTKTKMQRYCKQCGKVRHYQKNCKVYL